MRYKQKLEKEVKAIQWTGDNLREVQDFMLPYSPLKKAGDYLSIYPKMDGYNCENVPKDGFILRLSENFFQILTKERFDEFYEVL